MYRLSLARVGRCFVVTVVGALCFTGKAISGELKAEIRCNPPKKNYEYGINLSGFSSPIPENRVKEKSTYSVEEVGSGEAVPLDDATYAGIVVRIPETNVEGYTGAWLYGDFDPNQVYKVTVTYDDNQTESTVAKTPGKEGRGQDGDTEVSAEVTFPDNSDGSRLKLTSAYYFKNQYLGKTYRLNWRLSLSLDADVTTKSPAPNAQNVIDASMNYQFRGVYRLPTLVIGEGVRYYGYSTGLELAVPAAEMNQSLSSVNLKGNLRAVSMVPIIPDSLLLSWLRWTGTNKGFVPPSAYFGYAYVRPERSPASLTAENDPPYWRREWGVKWSFPLHSGIAGIVSYERSQPEGEKTDKANFEAELRFYLDNGKKYALNATYQKGSLPPTYKETEKFAAGVSLDPLRPTGK